MVIRVLAVAFSESRHNLYNPVMSTRSLQVTAWQWDKLEAMEGAQRELTGRGEHKLISCPLTHITQGPVVHLLSTTHAAIVACLCWEGPNSACSYKDSLLFLYLYSLPFESSPIHPQSFGMLLQLVLSSTHTIARSPSCNHSHQIQAVLGTAE